MTEQAFLRGLTLGGVIEQQGSVNPDGIAVVEGEREITWAEFDRAAWVVAGGLAAHGLEPGGVLACQVPSSADFLVLHVAAARAGLVLNPIHPACRSHEISHMLSFGRARAAIIAAAALPDYRQILQDLAMPGLALWTLDQLPHGAPPAVTVAPSAPFVLLFTSGTESQPKAVRHSADALLSNAYHLGREQHLGADDTVLCTAPLSHLFGLCSFYTAVTSGATTVVFPSFDVEFLLATMQRRHVSMLFAPPPHLLAMAELAQPPILPDFRLALSSGAPCPGALRERLHQRFGCLALDQWGMTECQAGIFNRRDDPMEKILSTSGKPAPGVEVRVVDDRSRRLAAGQVGPLHYRGPYLFDGYLGRPDLTAASFTEDGWFITGDLASIDEDGFVRIEGRSKDLVNRGGMKINPIEVEELLLAHPKIRQAAIVPMPDPRLGERSCLYVAPAKEAASLSLPEIVDYLLGRGLAKYKLPERLEVWPELPTTATRKIQRSVLKADIEGRLKPANLR